jgi:hypothetical protein
MIKNSQLSADELNTYFSSVATDSDLDPGSMQASIDSIAKMRTLMPLNLFLSMKFIVYLLQLTGQPQDQIKSQYWLYKYRAAELASVIAYIIYLVLRCGVPPAAWKKQS